jgi:hypothetical protein
MPNMDRHVALNKAVELGIANNWGSESVALAADRFYQFLADEEVDPEKAEAEEPRSGEFRLPWQGDGYTYFQFIDDSGIFYRVRGVSVERIASSHETGWSRVRGKLGTLRDLQMADGYNQAPAPRVIRVLRNNLQSKVLFV